MRSSPPGNDGRFFLFLQEPQGRVWKAERDSELGGEPRRSRADQGQEGTGLPPGWGQGQPLKHMGFLGEGGVHVFSILIHLLPHKKT